MLRIFSTLGLNPMIMEHQETDFIFIKFTIYVITWKITHFLMNAVRRVQVSISFNVLKTHYYFLCDFIK